MKDDPAIGCGYGVTFRGWMSKACGYHDEAYLEGSDAQKWLSRKDVDRAFLRNLLNKSTGHLGALKAIAAYSAYGVVRLVGAIFWEGKK